MSTKYYMLEYKCPTCKNTTVRTVTSGEISRFKSFKSMGEKYFYWCEDCGLENRKKKMRLSGFKFYMTSISKVVKDNDKT